MKNFIFILSFLNTTSFAARVADKRQLLDVIFDRSGQRHEYQITSTFEKNSHFTVSFRNERNKIQMRSVPAKQAELIKNEATRLIWENRYGRKPTAISNCHEYITIKTDQDATQVCYENKSVVGQSYGFLNSLHRLFQ